MAYRFTFTLDSVVAKASPRERAAQKLCDEVRRLGAVPTGGRQRGVLTIWRRGFTRCYSRIVIESPVWPAQTAPLADSYCVI